MSLAGVVLVMTVAGRDLVMNRHVPGYVDHPYKYAQQLQFTDALSEHRDPLGWTTEFSGGFPELQFYPPGVAALGSGFTALPGIDSAIGYWLMLVTVWFAPAIAGWACLILARGRPEIAALAGIGVGMCAFGYSGTFAGVGVGVLASRLALAAMLIAVGCFLRSVEAHEAKARRWLIAVALAMAVATGAHLYFVPMTLLGMAWMVWSPGQPRTGYEIRALGAAIAGVLVGGFWWWGLLAGGNMTVPYRASPLPMWSDLVVRPVGKPSGADWLVLVLAAVWAWWRVRRRSGERPFILIRMIEVALAIQIVAVICDVVLDIKFFAALRVIDGAIVWMLVAVALMVLTSRRLVGNLADLRLAIIAIALIWIVAQAQPALPDRFSEDLDGYAQGRPRALFEYLATGKGRVVFTGNDYEDSRIFGFTYRASGREALNGGPTTASPMQAMLLGGPGARSIEAFGENNVSLAGVRWRDALSDRGTAHQLHDRLVTLGVTQVVVVPNDERTPAMGPGKALADHSDLFPLDAVIGPFSVYHVAGADPSRVTSPDEAVSVRDVFDHRDRVTAALDARQPSKVVVHLLRSSYWTVRIDGLAVDPMDNEFREMQISVPAGSHQLVAELTPPQILIVGRIGLPLVGLLLLAASVWWPRRRSSHLDGASSSQDTLSGGHGAVSRRATQ